MTRRTRSLNRAHTLALAGLLCLAPCIASASLEITEIMYDAPGSDSGREWIEVTNTGTDSVDLGGYRFFESNTHHKLAAISGSSVLIPGASAVIVADAAKFSADFPEYAGAVLKSTFALSNTGETIAIKNGSSTTLALATYSSGDGASGDGGSLHRQGDSFVSALPNPGVYPGELRTVPKPEPPPQKTTSTKSKTKAAASTAKKTSTLEYQTASAVESEVDTTKTSSTFPALEWIVGLVALAVLGGVAVFFAQSKTSLVIAKETTNSGEEFDIVDI